MTGRPEQRALQLLAGGAAVLHQLAAAPRVLALERVGVRDLDAAPEGGGIFIFRGVDFNSDSGFQRIRIKRAFITALFEGYAILISQRPQRFSNRLGRFSIRFDADF